MLYQIPGQALLRNQRFIFMTFMSLYDKEQKTVEIKPSDTRIRKNEFVNELHNALRVELVVALTRLKQFVKDTKHSRDAALTVECAELYIEWTRVLIQRNNIDRDHILRFECCDIEERANTIKTKYDL